MYKMGKEELSLMEKHLERFPNISLVDYSKFLHEEVKSYKDFFYKQHENKRCSEYHDLLTHSEWLKVWEKGLFGAELMQEVTGAEKETAKRNDIINFIYIYRDYLSCIEKLNKWLSPSPALPRSKA